MQDINSSQHEAHSSQQAMNNQEANDIAYTRKMFNHTGKALLFQFILSVGITAVVMFIIVFISIMGSLSAEIASGGFIGQFDYDKIIASINIPVWTMPVLILVTMLIANTLPFFLCARKIKLRMADLFKWQNKSFKIILIISVVCLGVNAFGGFIVLALETLLNGVGVSMPTVDLGMEGAGTASIIMTAIATCIIAPITEEVIFRGILLKVFSKKGLMFGAVMSSLLFAVIHGNIPQAIPAFFIGMFFCYISISTNSILPAIIAHAVNNTFATAQMYISQQSEIFSAISGLILIVALLASIVIVALHFKRNHPIRQLRSPKSNGYKIAFSSWSIILTMVLYVGLGAFMMFESSIM